MRSSRGCFRCVIVSIADRSFASVLLDWLQRALYNIAGDWWQVRFCYQVHCTTLIEFWREVSTRTVGTAINLVDSCSHV